MRTTALLTCVRGLCCLAAHTQRLLIRSVGIYPSIETGANVCSVALPRSTRNHCKGERSSGKKEYNDSLSCIEFQASADVRVRVREGVIRVRVRKPTVSAIIGVTTHVQQLHVVLPFAWWMSPPPYFVCTYSC